MIVDIARNTFREAIRNKILYTIVFFAAAMLLFAIAVASISTSETARVLATMGMAAIEFFGLVITIFVGTNLVYKEVERKTVFNILSKPVRRWRFIVGKYLGLFATLLLVFGLMAALYAVIVAAHGAIDWLPGLMAGVVLLFCEMALMMGVVLMFSATSTPILSGMFTGSFFLASSNLDYLNLLMKDQTSPLIVWPATVIRHLMPDFGRFEVVHLVIYQQPVEPAFVLHQAGYAAIYIVLFVCAAVLLFNRREFL